MKKSPIVYIFFILLLLASCTIFLTIRKESKENVKARLYHQWQEKFVVPLESDKSYIRTASQSGQNVTLSEAQGYAMLMSVQAAQDGLTNQADFDKLYRYYLDNRINGTQLMSWRQTIKKGHKTDVSPNNATDGDLYIAYALIEASKLWRNDSERYGGQAKKLLSDILAYNYNTETKVLTVGNWADSSSDYYHLVRTSDTLPRQFEAFYHFSGNEVWKIIEDSMLSKLEVVSNQYDTGLLPDFIWVYADGGVEVAKANTVSNKFDGAYSSNACRLPYNLSQSHHETSQALVSKMLDFFMRQPKIYGTYSLRGKRLVSYESTSFAAPIIYAGLKMPAYQKLALDHKYLLMQELDDDYYTAALTVLTALDGL